MKTKAACILSLLALATPFSRAEVLTRMSLDDPSSVTPKVEADTQTKVEGASSLKITVQGPTTICLGEVLAPDIENAKLVYSAQVKTDLDGSAFLEMWAQVGGGQYFSRSMDAAVGQKTDWKSIQTPFLFQKGQIPEKITLTLVVNGKGTVWLDDVVLSKEPLQ